MQYLLTQEELDKLRDEKLIKIRRNIASRVYGLARSGAWPFGEDSRYGHELRNLVKAFGQILKEELNLPDNPA